ncbi:hypothetical protein ACQ4LE_005175 [Meloidogyne hapla]
MFIKQIIDINYIFCLIIGGILNLLVIWLVFKKTPKEMLVYSKIILQTSFCDLTFLIISFIVKPVLLLQDNTFMILENGFGNSFERPLNVIIYYIWIFNCFFISVGITVQFVYRYLILCRGIEIKTGRYFLMLTIAIIFEGILLGFYYCIGYPPIEARINNSNLLNFLEETTIVIHPVFFVDNSNICWIAWLLSFSFFGIICYIIIFICSSKIVRHIRENLIKSGFSSRLVDINKQMTLNMAIQASIPVLEFVPSIITAVGIISGSSIDWLLLLLCPFLDWLPVLNPLVTIITVTPYRRTFIGIIRKQQSSTHSVQKPIQLINQRNINGILVER